MAFGGFGLLTIAHVFLAVMLIIELGFTSYLVDGTNGWHWGHQPSSFNFMLFNSVWSILVLIYLAVFPAFLPSLFHNLVSLGLLVITTLFWFAGSIAMAALVGTPDCNGNNFCHVSQAGVAFGWFIWAVFLALTIVDGLAFMKGRGPGARADYSGKTGRPYAGA